MHAFFERLQITKTCVSTIIVAPVGVVRLGRQVRLFILRGSGGGGGEDVSLPVVHALLSRPESRTPPHLYDWGHFPSTFF